MLINVGGEIETRNKIVELVGLGFETNLFWAVEASLLTSLKWVHFFQLKYILLLKECLYVWNQLKGMVWLIYFYPKISVLIF